MEIFGVQIPLVWSLLIGCVGLVYVYGKRRNRLLKDAGFPGPEPDIYLGSLRRFISEGIDWDNKLGKKYGPVFGVWMGGIPMVTVMDPDILKEVLIKDFDTFPDRLNIDLDNFPLDLGIFNQTGSSWRRLRNIISPTFSGSKLRRMCDGLNTCAKQLTDNLVQVAEKDEVIEIKKYFGGFTLDAIASTAFGIHVDSQSDFDNRFITEMKRLFDSSFLENPMVFLTVLFPGLAPLMKKLGVSSFPRSTKKFFVKSLTEIIESRRNETKERREKRVDFLQLMLDAEDNKADQNGDTHADGKSHKKMTADEVMGQAFLFFLAGYETTASTLNFIAYVLATNPDVQEKLIQEIDTVIGDNEPDYDSVHKLPYMERVITETLRLYPVVPGLNREVSKTTTIKGWTFPKGIYINVPVPLLHRDPEIFPEPTKFNAERWETKSASDTMSYLPFGLGPRHCIGMRLAQVEMKIALSQILKKCIFVPSDETPATRLLMRACATKTGYESFMCLILSIDAREAELKEFKISGVFTPKKPIKLKVKLR